MLVHLVVLTCWICFSQSETSSSTTTSSSTATPPHIVFVVIDDLGWDDVGFRSHQIRTPTIDSLAAEGVILDQYYVQSVCSPSRATFLSGLYPLHNSINSWIQQGDSFGLPLNITTMADKLLESGYDTHAVGKWHLGFCKWQYTPTWRGFNSFYGYYGGGEDYFTHITGKGFDFRDDPSPRCGATCSQVAYQAKGSYSAQLFTERAIQIIEKHDAAKPLFLYLAYQSVHSPPEVPQSYIDAYNTTIQNHERRVFAGMLSCVDEGLTNLTTALKNKNMWDDTIFVFTTDNGGPTTTGDAVGSRNFPLRGGKHSIWEGGTRGTAFIHSNLLSKKGYVYKNLMHGADWFPTLMAAVGVPLKKEYALDGVNQWEAISNGGPAVRSSIYYGYDDPAVNLGVRLQDWKLLKLSGGKPDTWYPPVNSSESDDCGGKERECSYVSSVCFPGNDVTSHKPVVDPTVCCSLCSEDSSCVGWTLNFGASTCFLKSKLANAREGNCTSGSGSGPLPHGVGYMLFHLLNDPTEHVDLAPSQPAMVEKLASLLSQMKSTGVPQATNECGPPVIPNDPHVGPVWAPWC